VNPSVAASAWLARIPQAERIAAHRFTDARLVAWAMGGVLLISACWILSRRGVLGRLRKRLEAGRPRPWVTSALLAGVLALAVATVKAPYDAFAAAWLGSIATGARLGPGFAAHLKQSFAGVCPATLAAMLVIPPLHWLMRRAPRLWPALLGGALFALALAAWTPYALSLGPHLQPAPSGAVRDGLERLVIEAKLPVRDIYVSNDPNVDADVTGVFGRAQVVVGPELMAAPPAETRAFIAHIMGHYAHGDILAIFVIYGCFAVLAVFAAQKYAAPMARFMGARQVGGPADPEALPALLVVAVLSVAAAGLAEGAYLRWANVRADAYSLNHAREPDALAAVLEREWDHESVDPSPIETFLFYTHPPLEDRILHAMTWKAQHGG
jgi:STE24 endopeptidase